MCVKLDRCFFVFDLQLTMITYDAQNPDEVASVVGSWQRYADAVGVNERLQRQINETLLLF